MAMQRLLLDFFAESDMQVAAGCMKTLKYCALLHRNHFL